MERSLGWLVVLGALGCIPTYAPPIRGLHAGMPDRLGRGEVELGGTAGGTIAPPSYPTTGGPHLGYGLSRTLVLEVGGNLNFVVGSWATIWLGVRLPRERRLGRELKLVSDLELGAGAGLGGATASTTSPWRHTAFGFYQGLGVGLRWRWLGGFARVRLDASQGDVTPATLWPSALLGAEARAGHFVFALGAGAGGRWNTVDGFVGFWFYQAQVTMVFDLVPGASAR